MLILPVAEDFDKLLQNRILAAVASLRELGGVVIVAVNVAFVLVVAILCSKHRRAH